MRELTNAPMPVEHALQAELEALLADTGIAWTSLRNGFYTHSPDWLLGPRQRTGTIMAPADGPVSRTGRAEAAALILAGDRSVDGPITLTALDALNVSPLSPTRAERVAAMVSELLACRACVGFPLR